MMTDDLIWLWDEEDKLNVIPVSKRRHLLDPVDGVFCANFRLDKIVIYIICQRKARPTICSSSSSSSIKHYNIKVLKSSLQKSTRRRLYETAKATAKQLIHQDLNEFLRRFPVIPLEDVCYFPWWSHTVWLMAAYSKGFVLDQELKEGLVHFVGQMSVFNDPYLCERRYQKEEEEEDNSSKASDNNDGGETDDIPICRPHLLSTFSKLSNDPTSSNIHLAGAVRISYGGMVGDQHLIHREINHHVQKRMTLDKVRADEGKSFGTYVSDAISKTSNVLPDFDVCHRLPPAIDFHCSGIIRPIRAIVHVDNTAIRKAIWFLRSNLNFRDLKRPQSQCTTYAPLIGEPRLQQPDYPIPSWWQEVEAIMNREYKVYWIPVPTPVKKRSLEQMLRAEEKEKQRKQQKTLASFVRVVSSDKSKQ